MQAIREADRGRLAAVWMVWAPRLPIRFYWFAEDVDAEVVGTLARRGHCAEDTRDESVEHPGGLDRGRDRHAERIHRDGAK